MQVDSSIHLPQQQFPLPDPSFDDFFNMEMASTSSRSLSSRSPSPRSPIFPALPAYSNPQIVTQEPDSFFNLYLEDDFKDVNLAPNLNSGFGNLGAPYDFFNSLPSSDSGSPTSSLSNSAGSPTFTSDSSQLFTIDPQLVGTPSTSKAMSDFEVEEGEGEGEEEDGDEEDMIQPVKVAGHGKLRKGTVQSGGISKSATAPKSASRNKENAVMSQVVKRPAPDGKNDEDDDWRPTPEEYKKMSSKEKRQLRNKISARNFRVRRKEYISTLEADISERDRLLDAIRSELGSTQSENVALRQEIAALKRSLLAGRGVEDAPVLPPPAPLPTTSPVSATSNTNTNTSAPLPIPNTQKDVGMKNKPFWGGVGMGMGGITSVHTAIIPELNVGLGLTKLPLMENLNPLLNVPQLQDEPKPSITDQLTGFEGFMERDMFNLKTMDAYRMELWKKMGAQHQAHQQSQHKTPSQSPHLTGLASNMRPMFFRDDLPGLLSGKAFGPSKDAMPLGIKSQNVPISSPSSVTEKPIPTPGHAMLAAVASQTLLGKLGSAFWEAFSGSSSPSLTAGGSPHYFSANGGSKPHAWDADKVRKVLEGKAVVKVVDVEPVPTKVEPPSSPKLIPASPGRASSTSKWASSYCSRHQEKLAIQEATEKCPKISGEKGPEKRCEWEKCVHDLLEENFRTLSLGKKA